MYNVIFNAYCGMSYAILENVDRETVKSFLQKKFRLAKKKKILFTKIGKNKWEFETPEDASMVGDSEGILFVQKIKKPVNRRLIWS